MRFAGLQSPAGDRFGPFRGGGRTAAEDVPAAARLRRAWRAALLRHEAGRAAGRETYSPCVLAGRLPAPPNKIRPAARSTPWPICGHARPSRPA